MKEGTIYEIIPLSLKIENYLFKQGMQFKVISNENHRLDIMDIQTHQIYKGLSEMALEFASEEVSSWA